MVRCRLKRTPLIDELYRNVKGLFWYKPNWWEAVRRAPPNHFYPRIKKKEIPTIKYMEDRLLGDFAVSHPSIAAEDHRTPSHSISMSVTEDFVSKQIEELKKEQSQEEAFEAASRWMIENGKQIYRKLQMPLKQDSRMTMPEPIERDINPREHHLSRAMEQALRLKKTLEADLKTRRGTSKGFSGARMYRHFYSKEHMAALARRDVDHDPVLPSFQLTEADKAFIAEHQARLAKYREELKLESEGRIPPMDPVDDEPFVDMLHLGEDDIPFDPSSFKFKK